MNWYQLILPLLMFALGYINGRQTGWLKGFNTAKSIYEGTYEAPKRRGWLP